MILDFISVIKKKCEEFFAVSISLGLTVGCLYSNTIMIIANWYLTQLLYLKR